MENTFSNKISLSKEFIELTENDFVHAENKRQNEVVVKRRGR